jgi:hypothetical protein
MDAHQRVGRAVAAVIQAALCPAIVCGLLACSRAPAQEAPRSPHPGSESVTQSPHDSTAPGDSVARALDRIDAARARLQAADAVVTSAMRDLDAAIADAAQLSPTSEIPELSSATHRAEGEANRMATRWRNLGERWQETGGHWADFGERIAFHAERLARVEATAAERQAEREVDREMRRSLREDGHRNRASRHDDDSDDDDDR